MAQTAVDEMLSPMSLGASLYTVAV